MWKRSCGVGAFEPTANPRSGQPHFSHFNRRT